jgi:hypothetical protein
VEQRHGSASFAPPNTAPRARALPRSRSCDLAYSLGMAPAQRGPRRLPLFARQIPSSVRAYTRRLQLSLSSTETQSSLAGPRKDPASPARELPELPLSMTESRACGLKRALRRICCRHLHELAQVAKAAGLPPTGLGKDAIPTCPDRPARFCRDIAFSRTSALSQMLKSNTFALRHTPTAPAKRVEALHRGRFLSRANWMMARRPAEGGDKVTRISVDAMASGQRLSVQRRGRAHHPLRCGLLPESSHRPSNSRDSRILSLLVLEILGMSRRRFHGSRRSPGHSKPGYPASNRLPIEQRATTSELPATAN